MAAQILEEMLSHSVAVTQRERNVGNHDVDRTPVMIRATAIPLERRCEARTDYRCMCSYEVFEVIDEESAIIEQGKAFALNRSTEGMLLFMALAPHTKQLIEVHTPCFGWGRTANVFEVRWARPMPVESFGNLYLVGCQRIFGPCHYVSF